jgi:hypothetical protein
MHDLSSSPEILFFALMVCATARGDLSELEPSIGWNRSFSILGSALMIGAIVSAMLYGSLLFSSLFESSLGAEAVLFRSRLLIPSIVFAFVFLGISTWTEILLGKLDDKP